MSAARLTQDGKRSLREKISTLLAKLVWKIRKYTYYRREYLIVEAPLKKSDRPLGDDYLMRTSRDPIFLPTAKEQLPGRYELWKRRCEEGLACTMVLLRGRIIGWTWFSTKDYYEPTDRFTIRLKPNQIYQLDGFLFPEERKERVALRAMRAFHNVFIEMGFTHTVAVVEKSNQRNLNLHQAMGFSETGRQIVTRYAFTRPFSREIACGERYMKIRHRSPQMPSDQSN